METKKGVLTEIIFHNDENGYTIADMETDDELLTVVGNLSSAAKGTCLELTGTFKNHPRYGEQFVFTEAREVLPTTRAGIEGFLASGIIKGIGPKTAGAIVAKFGEETLQIIEKQPERLCEVPGIGLKKADVIAASFAEHREFADVSLFFQGYGVSAAQTLRLYKGYGKDAVSLIQENPYRLADELYGFGFRRADEVAARMGVAPDSPFRIQSGIRYGLMSYVSDGSTFVPQEILCEKVAQILELTREQVKDELVNMAFTGDVQLDTIRDEPVVYLYSYYLAEQKVCRNLVAIAHGDLKAPAVDIKKSIEMTETATGLRLSEKQKSAVLRAVTSGISVITGGPGTGKTTIINTIINVFEESGFNVAIAAPTGRAAKRITETSGHYASTIHRLLEYYYSEGMDEMQFGKNAEDPLDCDVVIIDEASMIDLLLMQSLTEAIRPGTRLILVGDSDQLPSVGAGNVLTDIIESGMIQTSRLTEIYRQAEESMIVVNAHRINHGEYPTLNGKDTDFFFMERSSEKEMQRLITELVTRRLPAYYGVDPVGEIQVLSPTKKGLVGTVELNSVLQEACNPASPDAAEKKFGDHVFRTGDKVMQIRNNYQMEWKIPGVAQSGQGVFNGDVGFIQAIDNEYGSLTVLYDDERFVQYDFSQLDELELAYAVTVHKSQGSEFPVVIMPVYDASGVVLEYKKKWYGAPDRVRKAIVSDLNHAEYPVNNIVPLIETVHDRAVVETFRGCTRGCRFCQAGMIYRPVRERSRENILRIAAEQLKRTGHDELALLSLSTSDYSDFEGLAMELTEYCRERNVSLSLPSLRLDSFSFQVLEEIQKYKKSGLTFAPEAGTQRLRDVINKGITEEDIYSAVEQAIELGWRHVKLYFMIGLPSETDADLDGIAEIAKNIINIHKRSGRGGRFNVTVSISNFVPKAHTPFQWFPQNSTEEFKRKHDYLTERLRIKGVTYNYHDDAVSTCEAVFARGDRRCGQLLLNAHRAGCRFDGWSEYFDRDKWNELLQNWEVDYRFYTERERSCDEVFPWDVIDSGVTKDFLLRENRKAEQAMTTADCRSGCSGCGVNQYTYCSQEGAHV